MQLFDLQQILSKYPKLSNTDELLQADILLMPAVRGLFINDQSLFDTSISEDFQVNFKFYSNSQTSLPCLLEESAISPEHIIDLGKIVSSIPGFYKLYEILTEKARGKKFRFENYVRIDESSCVLQKFEGTLEDYKSVRKDFKSSIEILVKNKENR
jgi:hypothetical protein